MAQLKSIKHSKLGFIQVPKQYWTQAYNEYAALLKGSAPHLVQPKVDVLAEKYKDLGSAATGGSTSNDIVNSLDDALNKANEIVSKEDGNFADDTSGGDGGYPLPDEPKTILGLPMPVVAIGGLVVVGVVGFVVWKYVIKNN